MTKALVYGSADLLLCNNLLVFTERSHGVSNHQHGSFLFSALGAQVLM